MKLTWLDISIVLLYLGSMVMIGWMLRKKARKNKESYLMGGKVPALVPAGTERCIGHV